MGNINNVRLKAKISLKIIIFLMGFWSFSFFASAYNDSCGEQALQMNNINLAKEVQIEKTFSLSGLNSDNINTILTGYTGLDYVGKSGNNLFFIHDNKLKKAIYQNGIIQDGNLFDFNNSINSKNDILTIENGFIYYKNKLDNDSIYKLNIYCSDSALKGAKISNSIPSDLLNYTYVFSDYSAIYYKDIFGKLYKIKNFYYGNDVENNNLVDTGIFIDSFLFYDTNESYFYYTYNGKTYKKYAGYYNLSVSLELYNFAINNYIFYDNNNIYYYDELNNATKYVRKNGASVLDDIFFYGKIEKYLTKYSNLNYFTFDFYNDGFAEVYRMLGNSASEQLTDLDGVIPLFVDNNLLIYNLKQYSEIGLIDKIYSLKLDGKVNHPPSSSSSSGGGTITNPAGENSQTNTNLTTNSDLVNQKILDHYKTKAIREKEAVKPSHEGDPVMLHSGEFVYENTLLNYPGVGLPFSFDITYKNQSRYSGPIGNNFDFSYNQYLTIEENGDVRYYDGKLGVVLFEYDEENDGFKYNTSTKSQLFFDGEFYKIVKNNTLTYTFNLDLKLDGIEDNYFNYIFIEHDNTKKIERIVDTLGNQYLFSYLSDTRLEKITDFNQNEVIFDYYNQDDESGGLYDLKSITLKNGSEEKTTNFEYTKGSDFDSSHNITKLIDFAGNIYVENTYDDFDRVSVQKFGEGDITYDYTLSTDESYIEKNEVTTRVGDKFIYTYNSGGQILSKEIFKKSGESYEYIYEYDSNNNLIKEKNPLGNGFTYSYDSKNNLIEKRQKVDVDSENNTNDIVVSFEYDDVFNKVTKEILPNGTTIYYTLDDFGNVVQKETIGYDIEIIEFFEYNELGQLVSKTDANGNISNFEYINGNLSKIIKIGSLENIETNFEYDSKGNIKKIIDGEGNETNLSYNDFNLLVSQITPEGIHTNFEYNSLNKKTKETIILNDITNKITSFEYDILDNPTNVTTNIDSQRNKTLVTKYDNDNRIIETQNGSNAKNTFEYDENGNITKKSTILNDNTQIITNYLYDLNDRLIKQINPNSSEINFTYDLFDRLIKALNSDDSYTTNTYDNMGNLLEIKSYDSSDNLVSKTSFEYDGLTRKTKQINHLLEENKQIITSFAYDNNGNILSQTNALNQTTTFLYDSFNRLVKTIDNLGNIIEYKYNKNDKIIEEIITGITGKALKKEYYYDSDGRLEIFHDNNGKSSSYNYNELGQLISYYDGNNTINYTYDLLGNKLSETNLGKVLNYEYDENSNMTKLIDANLNETNYEYDELNRLVKQIYPDNSYTSYEYDINSNVSKKIDGNGTSINYTYDNQNRLTEKNITNGVGIIGITKENYFYDSLGRLTKTTNNEGSETLFSYDSLNRLTSETQNGKLVNYTYDNLGNRTSISIDGKTTGYNYDNNSRLETITRENNELVRYNYDSLNLLNQTYSNGQTTTYGYDEYYNRLTNLTTLNKNYEYHYTANNLIQSNGYEDYIYDNLNQITQVNFNTRFVNKDTIEYSYDQMGNRLNEMYSRINKKGNINYFKDFTYTTNNLNQYTNKELYNPNNESFSAESYEGLVEDVESLNTTESESFFAESYEGQDEDGENNETPIELNGKLIYDKNGNMIGNMLNNKRQYIYSYDYKNRLVKVEKTIYKTIEGTETNEVQEIVKIIQYKYDNLDRRIQKIFNNGSYRNYYYSNKDIILEENYTKPNANGISKLKTSKYFINGNSIDDVLAMEKVDYKSRKVQEEYTNKKGQIKTRTINETYTETNTYFYHKNHLNSIVAITDNLGNILEEYEYDVFGKPYSKDINTGKVTNLKTSSIGNTRLFIGREYERGLQLYYNRARYYNPELGRFISRDPIDISDDVNLYSYVGNSPVSFVDPMGTEKILIVVGRDFLKFSHPNIYGNGDNDQLDVFVGGMLNTLTEQLKSEGKKYDIEFVTDFSSFDTAINSKQRETIYAIGHGSASKITFSGFLGYFDGINENSLLKDIQTKKEAERLRDTTMILLSCDTGNINKNDKTIGELVQKHYGFKETLAPSTTIWSNGVIADNFNNKTGEISGQGKLNIFK